MHLSITKREVLHNHQNTKQMEFKLFYGYNSDVTKNLNELARNNSIDTLTPFETDGKAYMKVLVGYTAKK